MLSPVVFCFLWEFFQAMGIIGGIGTLEDFLGGSIAISLAAIFVCFMTKKCTINKESE
jgi:hypothetical protein